MSPNTAHSGTDASRTETTFECDARFGSATFNRRAGFDGANFECDAEFSGAVFADDAGFREVNFKGDARYENTTFVRNAYF